MPCYQINTFTMEFKAQNIDLLLSALNEMDIKYDYDRTYNIIDIQSGDAVINLQNGTVRTSSMNLVNRIKRKYSEEALKQVAKRKRWVMKKATQTTGSLRRF